jgi:hypothetical protein
VVVALVVDTLVVMARLVGAARVVAPAVASMTSWGATMALSRLAYRPAEALVAVSTKLVIPSPGTSEVTSTLVQLPGATGPDLPTSAPGTGALA